MRIYSLKLVCDVAKYLKKLAGDSGLINTAILDGDVCPQSKRNTFNHRSYKSTMARINSCYCHQSAMKIVAKGTDKMTGKDKKRLDLLNNETKTLLSSI